MATVIVPALLRNLTGGVERVTVTGKNVREVIADLDRQFPGCSARLVEGNKLKPALAVAVDGDMAARGLLEPVRENSEIHFVPAIRGGQ